MSSAEIIHPVPVDDLDPWVRSLRQALLNDPDSPEARVRIEHRRRTWVPERAWGVRDRGAWVGSLATEDRSVTIPGGTAGATRVLDGVDALTAVSVAATHRRQGLLRRMLEQSLAEAKDRGDAVSVLIAAEWPIYGRFGYAPATTAARYRYRIRGRGAAPTSGDPSTLRPVTPAELAEVAPELFERARRRRAGQMDRDRTWWARRLGTDGFEPLPSPPQWLLHESDGTADGLLARRTTADFELDNTYGAATVEEFVAASDGAYADLWAYLAGLDLIDEIRLDNRPVDEPAKWLLGDGRALHQVAALDGLWLRLLDVPAALAARGYAGQGDVVLEVTDNTAGGYAAGRFLLETGGATARCSPTDRAPELRVDQRVLAAAYLGGHRLAARAPAGGVTELRDGALARADVLFSTPLAPVNETDF